MAEVLTERVITHARTGTRTHDARQSANAVRNTVAVVLAGGRGSRLKQLTDWRAKPAVAFGGKFRIVDFTLSNCINSGIRRIDICTQYKAHSLIRHVQRGWSFLDGRFDEFCELMPAQQRTDGNWYQGTADAVYQNIDILRRQDPELVLVLAGEVPRPRSHGQVLAIGTHLDAAETIEVVRTEREQVLVA